MPNVPSAADTLAWIYYKRRLYDSALPLLEEAVKAQPQNPTFRIHLASVLLKQGKRDAAKDEAIKAIKADARLRNDPEAQPLIAELSL
jgi:predicted Zn-dependent protease